MSTLFTTSPHHAAISLAERQRRERAVREAVASATIEGGMVGPDAHAIMNEWAQGLIDQATMFARVDALHAR